MFSYSLFPTTHRKKTSVCLGVIGLALMLLNERVILRGSVHAEVEHLFGNAYVIAAGLATVGVMIMLSARQQPADTSRRLGVRDSAWIGAVQAVEKLRRIREKSTFRE